MKNRENKKLLKTFKIPKKNHMFNTESVILIIKNVLYFC